MIGLADGEYCVILAEVV